MFAKKTGQDLINSAMSKITSIVEEVDKGVEMIEAEKISTELTLENKRKQWENTEATLKSQIDECNSSINLGTRFKRNISKLFE